MRPCCFQVFRAGRWRALALLALVGLQAPAVAQAQTQDNESKESALELEWRSNDPGCDAADVASEALRLVGSSTPRRIAATAQVWRDGDAWIVQLDTRSATHTGRRVLRSQSCDDLRQALALLLAMILESEVDPDEIELPAKAPAAQSAGTASPPESRSFLSELDGLLQAGASAARGLKPAWALGVGAGAGLRWRRLETWVRFTHWPVTRSTFELPMGGGAGVAEILRNDLTLALCANVELGRSIELVPCVSPELTFFGYKAAGIEDAREGRLKPRPSVTGSLDLRYWLSGQWLFAAIGAGVTWERPQPFQVRYECEDEGEPECTPSSAIVYTTDGLGPRFTLGVGARF